jgi:acyl-CoA reductase-like NAD-dependent aldehyde dehydrogenase
LYADQAPLERTAPPIMSYPDIRLYLDGAFVDGRADARLKVRNPADGTALAEYAAASADDLQAALAAAERGFAVWSRTLPVERFRRITHASALIRERAPTIARVLTLEQGKPLAESLREVQLAAEIIDFLAEEGKRLAARGVPPRLPNVLSQTVERVPVGPVAAFTPWNFPANLPARKIGGALAAGCSVIIKPDEQGHLSGTGARLSRGRPAAGRAERRARRPAADLVDADRQPGDREGFVHRFGPGRQAARRAGGAAREALHR